MRSLCLSLDRRYSGLLMNCQPYMWVETKGRVAAGCCKVKRKLPFPSSLSLSYFIFLNKSENLTLSPE